MTDIVERLWQSDEASALTNEAAREIERLRAALLHIIDRSENGDLGTSKVIDMRCIAESALGGKDD